MGDGSSSGFLKIWRRAWQKPSGRKPVDSKPISNWVPSSLYLLSLHFIFVGLLHYLLEAAVIRNVGKWKRLVARLWRVIGMLLSIG